MKISCSAPSEVASDDLSRRISQLGLKPIISSSYIKAEYIGVNQVVADTLIEIFQLESEHEINIDYKYIRRSYDNLQIVK